MIIEELTKLDKPKRILAAILTVLVAGCICYFAITRDSVVKLQAAEANYANVQVAYAETENQHAELSNLQKQLEEKEKQLKEAQQQCFSSAQAVQFFENINAVALAYNLKPISRIISEPKELVINKEATPQQQFLKTRSAKITVCGNYFDIVDFLNELTRYPQRVCITEVHIVLDAGEKFNPKASFEVILIIDQSRDVEK
jgi:Tfp pilus assembly protein PilO